ncbi:hypothetical protein [Litoreibacter roseus]|uniref:DUF2306 domain-containing protein n=1 Tax=Litoreibacter roseus TaxID=2601869 RepID=A0A6N6JKH0_9RHOB|nr:hypothetical protein [Litoreibacter roseus]GFE66811.1 hypothetical protein KIN_38850 [Litoreibacter roseus]
MLELTPVLAWLEASALADWVGGPIYPLISAMHILSISFLIAPIILADLRVMRLKRTDDAVVKLSRIALLGFGAAATTGVLLFAVQATRYAENPAVLIKFALILLAGANAALFAAFKSMRPVTASLSICLWCAGLVAGRWIAFAA